ncbi:MAG: topoisomerase-4 subunit A [Salibacteraceae bacterium]|jgi:topoisomerase-4 subunit A
MSIDENENINEQPEFENEGASDMEHVIRVSGLYEDWFLDYASYVILERAVPHLNDGLKPVQRRILHSMRELEDGRYNKVANVVGNTMKYHPHGDASIADAMVQIGQKDLLIDTQGNWGSIFTGDGAAAARYIEARLTKFALEVIFNPKTTDWQQSYDGRNREPITQPVKFPLLLAQGVEGIAVGMACKILPHNFIELIDQSINALLDKRVKILPDFMTGGMADFSNYNDGLRGGKVKVRAKMEIVDSKTLKIVEIPFGSDTGTLMESIVKANEKGKIKVKKIEDNTASEVEILVHLAPGTSPDNMMDALYAFTDCEKSVSPNASVIMDDKPHFIGVSEMLKYSALRTKDLLEQELQIKLAELQEKWHQSSLEKIFIENKLYIEFDGKTYEEAKVYTLKALAPFVKNLMRAVTDEDLSKLMDIPMRRITKHDAEKADTFITNLEDEMAKVRHHLDHLTQFAVDYFKELKRKYGKGRERKTEIKSFITIDATKVAAANVKLYVNMVEGFVGTGLKRNEGDFLTNCSDMDDVIVILNDGKLRVTRVSDKTFVGKNILYVGIWEKEDERTTYNLIYRDGATGPVRAKRFQVTSITRDKDYDLTRGIPKTKLLYFTANPNGEAEKVSIVLRNTGKVKKLKFDFDFAELAIKGRGAGGNILTKHIVAKVDLKEQGVSTLSARKIWFDDSVSSFNSDDRGNLLGEFKGEDKILHITSNGHYRLTGFDVSTKVDDDYLILEKWNPNKPITAVYWDGEKEQYFVKRFLIEETTRKVSFISEQDDSHLEVVTSDWRPVIQISFDKRTNDREDESINMEEFIALKSYKAQGNRLTKYKVKSVDLGESLMYEEIVPDPEDEDNDESQPTLF